MSDKKSKIIDKKNHKVGVFDLGNHILIIGLVLVVIFMVKIHLHIVHMIIKCQKINYLILIN